MGVLHPKSENKISQPKTKAHSKNTSTAQVSTIARQKINASHSPTIQIQTKNLKAYKSLPTLLSKQQIILDISKWADISCV